MQGVEWQLSRRGHPSALAAPSKCIVVPSCQYERARIFPRIFDSVRSEAESKLRLEGLSLEEAMSLAKGMRTHRVLLKTLDLSDSHLGHGLGASCWSAEANHGVSERHLLDVSFDICLELHVVKALAMGLKGSSVTSLNLQNTDLQDEGCGAFAAVLPQSSVRSLQLADNWVGIMGLRALAAALPGSCVTSLGLSNNFFGNAGIPALAAVLRTSCVESLDLSQNSLEAEAAEALATGLKGSSVTSLSLQENPLEDEGVEVLAEVLKDCPLESLELGWTEFADAGMKALAAALKESSICCLDIRYAHLSKKGRQALIEGARDSPLTKIWLEGCGFGFGEGPRGELKEILAKNCRSFILQMEVQESENGTLSLKFRTLAGTVAAVLAWNLESAAHDLPEAVLSAMVSSGFQLPFKGLGAGNLKIVPAGGQGALLDVGPTAAPLAQQLGLSTESGVRADSKRGREGHDAPSKRSRKKR